MATKTLARDGFGNDEPELIPPLLTAEIAQLAASLGLTTETGARSPYKPDAFVEAVKREHDKLMEVKRALSSQCEAQRAKALELAKREASVTFREERVAAHEKLIGKRPGYLRRLLCS